jgi:hypothetical protein
MRPHGRKHSAISERGAPTVEEVGRKVDVDQLVGAEEIAERLGLTSVRRVHELRARNPEFPQPIKQLRRTMLFLWRDVEAWAKRTGRL